MAEARPMPIVIAELRDGQLHHFLHHIRSNESSANCDLSHMIKDFNDLARVLQVEERLRWARHGEVHQRYFHLTEADWKCLVDRLVNVLQYGLDNLDGARSAMMAQDKNTCREPIGEVLVRTIPQDIMRLYQSSWKLLGLAQMAQLRKPRWLPPNCTLAHFDSFAERFNSIEMALMQNKLLARNTFDSLDWMYRLAAHPMAEQEKNKQTDQRLKGMVDRDIGYTAGP